MTPSIIELTPSLYCLQLHDDRAHMLNSYVWLSPNGTTLIDCGWPDSAPVIERALIELGRGASDVERLVLTHFHEDHAGSAAQIAEWADVEICAGSDDARFVTGEQSGPVPQLTIAERAIHSDFDQPPAAPPSRVDRRLQHDDVLDFAGGARVLSVPGHTPGSIALHLPDADTLLTGDAVAEFQGNVILGVFNADRMLAAQSLAALQNVDADRAGFGHGNPVTAGASQLLMHVMDSFSEG